MNRYRFFLIFLFCGTLAAQSPSETLQNTFSSLRDQLRDTSKFKIETLIDESMDWEEITRRALEANWVNLSAGWQRRFRESVRTRITAQIKNYLISQAAGLLKQPMRWSDEEAGDNRARVTLEIMEPSQKIGFRLSEVNGTWKIYDIRTETYRLIRDALTGFDDLLSAGYSNEYVEAMILNKPAFVIEDFNNNEVQDFPKNWGWRKKDDDLMRSAPKLYRITKDQENKILSASLTDASVSLVKPFSFNLNDYPVLSWRWRVRHFPESDNTQDPPIAASVTIIFYQNWIGVPITIRYVWRRDATPCSILREEGWLYDAHAIVLRDQRDAAQGWVTEEVDLREDYRRIFGEYPPEQITGVYLLSESNSPSTVEADYDDFQAKRTARSLTCGR